MSIVERGNKFLQNKLPQATVLNRKQLLKHHITGKVIKPFWMQIASNPQSGTKQRMITVHNLGDSSEILVLAETCVNGFKELDSSVETSFDNETKRIRSPMSSSQMVFAPMVFLYTDNSVIVSDECISMFMREGIQVEIISESEMFESVFISYGGEDEVLASKLNKSLNKKGINTWFFPDDALPGEKLHRAMHNGVNKYNRVLLICSENSLKRPGVLNEIEKVLEREARDGGAEILIPVTLDNYVHTNWNQKKDIVQQVQNRVILELINDDSDFDKIVERIIGALKL